MSTQASAESHSTSMTPRLFGLLLFGASLAAIGSFDFVGQGEGAVVFGCFIGGLGELIAGLWELKVGDDHIGTVMAAFGTWLLGLFLLFSVGGQLGLASPAALAIYMLVFLVPVVLLYIPVYANQLPWNVHLTFIALFVLQLFTGVSFIYESQPVVLIAGSAGYVAACCIWYLCYEDIRETMIAVEVDAEERSATHSENLSN